MRNWEVIRPSGSEPPYVPIFKGIFKFRIPGYHYKWEWADFAQGLLMCAVCLSIIPLLTEILGMPFEVGLAIVVLNGFLYLWHSLLGDPVVPGWVTPAIPLLVAYVSGFPMGPERVQALVAFELELGLWCVFLGVTGLGPKVLNLIPDSVKAGVILGAGISAVKAIMEKGGRFESFPLTITIAVGLAFFLTYSEWYQQLQKKWKILEVIGRLGLLPSIVVAIVVASLVKEAAWPTIQWGFSKPDFVQLWRDWVPWGKIGWPSWDMYVKAFPTMLAAYIVIFGEALQARGIIEAAQEIRKDEPIDYNLNRVHIIVGLRNSIMSVIAPDISMCGPMWAAMTVVMYEKWKKGREAMDSIFGGVGSFRWGTFVGYWLLPVVTAVKNILPVAISLTYLIQGFVAAYIAIQRYAKTFRDIGIAGVIAATEAVKGAAYGFAVGFVLVFLIYFTPSLLTKGKTSEMY